MRATIINECKSFMKLFKICPDDISLCNYPCTLHATNIIKHGIIFVDEALDPMEEVDIDLVNAAIDIYGANERQFNNTFYKSFADVKNATISQLVFDQLLHYFSTYGAEALGISVPTYVPVSKLNINGIPKLDNEYKFVVIQLLSKEKCIERLDDYLSYLSAPNSSVIDDIKTLLPLTTLNIDQIKSFEIQCIKYSFDNKIPDDPVSFLRYLVYTTTKETLLIKNKDLIEKIKSATDNKHTTVYNLFSQYPEEKLASIFLRFKPIFLAFKGYKNCAPVINRLRRKADKFHQPLPFNCLQNLTNIDDFNVSIDLLSKATNRQLIKIINTSYEHLQKRDEKTKVPDVYNIRNGKIFVKDNLPKKKNSYFYLYPFALDILRKRLSNLRNKSFYIPSYITYAAPFTEKQFIGNIPYGSKINIDLNNSFTIGIHWFNDSKRTDIDLHLNSPLKHLGWNGCYKDDDEDVFYTGDQTDAPLPNGAAEAYWVNSSQDQLYIATAALYSGNDGTKFKMFMTESKPDNLNELYTYNPNTALFPAIPLSFNKGSTQTTLGLIDKNSFYFYGGSLSNDRVPSSNYESFIKGISVQLKSKFTMNNLLKLCGANVYDEDDLDKLNNDELKDVISLCPEDLKIDTLINIVDGV